MAQPTLAEIRMFAGNFAPRGWALCQGQLLSISENQALFSLLGTIYGGDGRTTFALPDLRGRAAISAGHGPGLTDYRQGEKAGVENNNMSIQQMPSHNHAHAIQLKAAPGDGTTGIADGNSLAHEARGNNVLDIYNSAPPSINMKEGSAKVTLTQTGQGQDINNMQPFTCLNYIIALQGIFPSRT